MNNNEDDLLTLLTTSKFCAPNDVYEANDIFYLFYEIGEDIRLISDEKSRDFNLKICRCINFLSHALLVDGTFFYNKTASYYLKIRSGVQYMFDELLQSELKDMLTESVNYFDQAVNIWKKHLELDEDLFDICFVSKPDKVPLSHTWWI